MELWDPLGDLYIPPERAHILGEIEQGVQTWLFIGLVAILVIADGLLWQRLSLTRRLVTVFAVLAALHEIEEKIWPGGFYELMLKKFGMRKEEVDIGRATLVVSIYWLLLLGSAYIFDSHRFLLAVTITLSFFEAFIHTAGIFIHHMKKPYTPGLVTAWCLAAAAVFSIHALRAEGAVLPRDFWIGALLWPVTFVCMDSVILSGLGKKPSDLIAALKSQKNTK